MYDGIVFKELGVMGYFYRLYGSGKDLCFNLKLNNHKKIKKKRNICIEATAAVEIFHLIMGYFYRVNCGS
jgi:hypothetical protein